MCLEMYLDLTVMRRAIDNKQLIFVAKKNKDHKPQLHCHDLGHDGATTHPDLSSRDASA